MDMNSKIEEYIHDSPVIIFMKGTPEQPRCGFSATAVKALIACGETFSFIDVLANPEIRAALPAYGDWPSFPQVWANAELIGGADIVNELHENGELKEVILEALKSAQIKEMLSDPAQI